MYVKQDYHNNHHHNNNHNHNGHHHSSNHHSHNNHHNYNNNNNNNYDYDDRYSEDHHHHHHHSTEVSDSDTSDDEDNTCPLCCEEFDLFDRGFKPCACGYQICQFCYKNIRENPELNGKCPACRRTYDEKLAEYQTITPEEWKQYQIKKDAKEKRRKQREREMRKEVMVSGNGLVGTNSNNNNNNNSNNSNSNSNNNNNIGSTTAAALNSIGSGNAAAAAAALNGIFDGLGMGKDGSGSYRKHLAGVRVIQKNLVYVIGYQSNSTIDELEKMLSSDDYFGRYGKIKKIVINKRFSNGPIGSGASGHSSNSSGGATSGAPSLGIYVTYVRKDDAAKCIAAVDGSVNDDGKYLRAAYGTTKYCSSYLKGQTCPNPNCMFLHEPGEEADGFYNGKNSEASHLHAVAGSQVQAVVGALNGKISRELSPMLLHAKLNGGNFAVGSLLSGSPLNSSNLQHSQNGGNPVGNTLHEEDHSIPALPATASWGSGLNKSSPRVGGAKLVLDVSSSLASSAVSSSSSPGSTAGSASPTVNTPSTASTTASATSTTTTTTTATTTTTTTTTATPSPSTTPTPVPVVTKKEEIMTPKRALPLAPMTSRLIEGILSNMEDRFGERVSKGKKNSIRIKPVSEYGVKFDSSLFTSEELEEIEGLPTFFTVFDRFPNDSEGYSNYCYDLSDDLRHYSDLIEKRGMDFGVRSRAVFSLRETFGEEGNRDDADNDENNNNNNSHELIQVINGNTILEGLNQPTSGNLGNQLNQANLNVNMNVNTSMSSPRSSQMAHQGTPPPGLNSEYGHGQMNGSGGHGSGSNSQELLARLMNGGRSR